MYCYNSTLITRYDIKTLLINMWDTIIAIGLSLSRVAVMFLAFWGCQNITMSIIEFDNHSTFGTTLWDIILLRTHIMCLQCLIISIELTASTYVLSFVLASSNWIQSHISPWIMSLSKISSAALILDLWPMKLSFMVQGHNLPFLTHVEKL